MDWTTIRGGRTVVPTENQRRLVADGDRLYATLSFQAPLTVLDAATGETLATVPETQPVKEILASDGIVVVHSREAGADTDRRRGKAGKKPSRLVAVRGDSGNVLWRKDTEAINDLFVAVDGGRVVYQAGGNLACLEATSGKSLWQTPAPVGKGRTLIAHDGCVVVYAARPPPCVRRGVGRASVAATGTAFIRR